MSKMLENLKSEGTEAGYRIAANQMTKGVKTAIVAMMTDKGADGGKLAAVKDFLDSDVGEALISVALGFGLPYVPTVGEDPRVQKLANEFRVGGMATAGNFAFDTAFQYFLPAVGNVLENLPALPEQQKVRLDDEEENEVAEKKAARSG